MTRFCHLRDCFNRSIRIAPVYLRGTAPNERTGEPLVLVTVFTDGTQIGTTIARNIKFELECPQQISAKQAPGYCNGRVLWYGVWITKMISDGV